LFSYGNGSGKRVLVDAVRLIGGGVVVDALALIHPTGYYGLQFCRADKR